MHLSPEFGETVKEIEKDGFEISHKLPILPTDDAVLAMAKGVGTAILAMADAFDASPPEFILLEGDRGESLAAAIAAAHMNIAVAHVSGGDVTGTIIDEGIRHSITKFAHVHFPGTDMSSKRLLLMGEDPWRVHMVGTPGVNLKSELSMTPEEVARELDLGGTEKVVAVLQHPVTTEADDAPEQIRETMAAISALAAETVVIYPNADAGGREMIKVIKEYEHLPFIHCFKSLPRATYVGLLSMADVLVGNSSSGIVEAPDFGLPTVNVGTRQLGREHGGNLFNVGYSQVEIQDAISYIIEHRDDTELHERCSQSPYQDIDTGAQIAQVLSTVELGPSLIQKMFCDDLLHLQGQERLSNDSH